MKKTIITALLSWLLLGFAPAAFPQATGLVEFPYLGVNFTIPNGWVGQEIEGGYIIGHQTQPGFGFLTVMEANSLEEIRQEAAKGIMDAEGTSLQLSGSLTEISASSLGGMFEGKLQHQPVKAYMIGVLNPHGQGVTVLTAGSPGIFSDVHKNLAIELSKSLQFSKAKTSPEAAQWKEKFQNAKLTYMDSYYSSGGSYNGFSTGGGYSTTKEIHLCSQGYFRYKSSDFTSMDTGGAFGSSHGGSSGDGTWEIGANVQGKPTLVLKFLDGNVHEYILTYEDKKTFLNGNRYYVTYASSGADYAPDCF